MASFTFQIKQIEQMPIGDRILIPAPAGVGVSLVKSAEGEITLYINKV